MSGLTLNPVITAQVLLALAIILLCLSVANVRPQGPVLEYHRRRRRIVEEALDELGMENLGADQFLAFVALIAVVFFFIAVAFSMHWILAASIAIGIFLSQELYFVYHRQRRRELFDNRLPMALDQIVSSAKAGLNLSQCLQEVSKFAPSPVDAELSKIVREQALGSDIPTSLVNARTRMKSHTFNLAVSALLINIRQGGDLPKAMEKISQALKEVWRLEQKIFTASSEARKGAMVMSVMPFVILIMVLTMQPDMLEALTGSLMGWGFLAAAAMLYVGGLYWMRQIINADV